ncbi:MAG: c-type cytochrome [Bradymonadaceae bacterium]
MSKTSDEPLVQSKPWIIPVIIAVVVAVFLVLAYALFSARVPLDHVPEDPEGPVSGQEIYAQYCQVCHGQDGKGSPGRNPPLTEEKWLEGDIPILITLGGMQGPVEIDGVRYDAMMPPLGHRLSNVEIAAVLTYVRTSFGNDLGEVAPEDVARVRQTHDPTRGPYRADELQNP